MPGILVSGSTLPCRRRVKFLGIRQPVDRRVVLVVVAEGVEAAEEVAVAVVAYRVDN